MLHLNVLENVQLLSNNAWLCFDELEERLALLPTKAFTETLHSV